MPRSPHSPQYTQANIAAWDEVAPIHAKHNQIHLEAAFNIPNYSCLDEIETNILQQLGVAGKDVAQVCCNNGRELISVKNLGAARCVGFDGAQGFIDQARSLAQAAQQDVEFVCCDAYAIPPEFSGCFDIVTITIGVLGWMPDIDGFLASVAALLKPNGVLFIYEHHPVLMMVKPDQADAPIEWELSYFHTDPFVEHGGLDYYGGETYDAKPVTSFSHKMSDIIMSAIKAGLAVEAFEEYPHHISNAWYNVESASIGLPMCYTLVMRKSAHPL